MKKTVKQKYPIGIYWHVHHEEMVEYCYNPKERRRYIKLDKPEEERTIRLRLMSPVKHVPAKLLPLLKAAVAAQAKYNRTGLGEHWQARCEANRELEDAIASISGRTWARLHKQECKDCPWKHTPGSTLTTGTIFPPGWRVRTYSPKGQT